MHEFQSTPKFDCRGICALVGFALFHPDGLVRPDRMLVVRDRLQLTPWRMQLKQMGKCSSHCRLIPVNKLTKPISITFNSLKSTDYSELLTPIMSPQFTSEPTVSDRIQDSWPLLALRNDTTVLNIMACYAT